MKPTSFQSNTTPWRVQVPGRYFPDGKRKAKYFGTRAQAEEFIKSLKKHGTAAVASPSLAAAKTETDRYQALIAHALEKLGNDPARLFEAINHFERTKANLRPATVREGIEQFLAIRKSKVDHSTYHANRCHLLKLMRAFERHPVADLTEADLRRFFDSVPGHVRSIYKSLKVFFRWAKDYGFLAINPMLDIRPVGQWGVRKDIYQPETFERMLRIAAGLEPVRPGGELTREFLPLLPWFALSGFCGLRTCEAYRYRTESDCIRWTDMHWQLGFITVRDGVAKATRRDSDRRDIETPHYLESVKAWLDLLPAGDRFIVPFTRAKMQKLKSAFKKQTGIQLLENGLRNSFASYALTYNGLQGVGKLALEMGNSEGVCKRFYVRTLPPGSGRAWFNLRPDRPANIVPMPAVAA